MLDHLPMQPEPSCKASFLAELEFSGDASFHPLSDQVVTRDIVLGAGGSALAHVLALLAAVLLPFTQAPLPPKGFVTVTLVEMGRSHSELGDTGSLEGASRVQEKDMPPIAEDEQDGTPSPEPPRTVRQIERMRVPREESMKRAPPRRAPKPLATQVPPDPAPEELPALTALSSPDAAVKTGAIGAPEGRGHGAKGAGGAAGFGAAGGSSEGACMHGGEFSADTVDKVPQAVQKVEPIYPLKARKEGVCGRVVLKFVVEPDGHVSRPSIQEASPAGYFEQTALDAIRHWRFKPGIYRGKAVATWVVMPVQFRLTN